MQHLTIRGIMHYFIALALRKLFQAETSIGFSDTMHVLTKVALSIQKIIRYQVQAS